MSDAESAPAELTVAHRETTAHIVVAPPRSTSSTAGSGRSGDGPGGRWVRWHGVAGALLRLKVPKLKKLVHFDSEGSMFVAFGRGRDALARLAELTLEAKNDPAVRKDAIGKVNPKLMG